jgi:D-lactate dehydrogenase
MKLFVYNLRDYDEKVYYDQFCAQYGYEYTATADYPSLDNAGLAAGCQALSIIVCEMTPAMLERFAALGIRYIITRSIGAEHLDAAKANALGMRISNVSYTPDAVANFTVALMLMACRRIPYILQRTALQDYSLPGKMGRELSRCTVGVIGAGRIGAAVLRRLSGFGCRLLATIPFQTRPPPRLLNLSVCQSCTRRAI